MNLIGLKTTQPMERDGDSSIAESSAVRLVDVGHIYRTRSGPVTAIDSVSTEIAENEFIAVVGPSGCGKSTLLKIIASLILPSQGQVERFGMRADKPTPDIGMVFQAPVLLNWRNVLDNVLLPIEILGYSRKQYREKAMHLLERARISDFASKYPRELSGGMQQRVAICRALVYDAKLLLMDEPFGALDALTRDHMNEELLRLWSEERKTTLLITHSISEAVFLADRVMVMCHRPGRIMRDIPIELPRPRDPAVRTSTEFTDYVRAILAELTASAEDGRL